MSRTRQLTEGASVAIRSMALGLPSGHVIPPHAHAWDQLVYATNGVMTVEAVGASWVVPPRRAVWVPAGFEHRIETTGRVEMRTLYLRPGLAPARSAECCVVHVSPLLRELILHAIELGPLDRSVPAHDHLTGVILNQLESLAVVPLVLAMPRDSRARRVAVALRADPASKATVESVARGAGASKRTIERLFREQTGMSVGSWRQQLRLLCALRLLASGEQVTRVALDVGYDSTSAFVSMFRRALGTTPGRYYGT